MSDQNPENDKPEELSEKAKAFRDMVPDKDTPIDAPLLRGFNVHAGAEAHEETN